MTKHTEAVSLNVRLPHRTTNALGKSSQTCRNQIPMNGELCFSPCGLKSALVILCLPTLPGAGPFLVPKAWAKLASAVFGMWPVSEFGSFTDAISWQSTWEPTGASRWRGRLPQRHGHPPQRRQLWPQAPWLGLFGPIRTQACRKCGKTETACVAGWCFGQHLYLQCSVSWVSCHDLWMLPSEAYWIVSQLGPNPNPNICRTNAQTLSGTLDAEAFKHEARERRVNLLSAL